MSAERDLSLYLLYHPKEQIQEVIRGQLSDVKYPDVMANIQMALGSEFAEWFDGFPGLDKKRPMANDNSLRESNLNIKPGYLHYRSHPSIPPYCPGYWELKVMPAWHVTQAVWIDLSTQVFSQRWMTPENLDHRDANHWSMSFMINQKIGNLPIPSRIDFTGKFTPGSFEITDFSLACHRISSEETVSALRKNITATVKNGTVRLTCSPQIREPQLDITLPGCPHYYGLYEQVEQVDGFYLKDGNRIEAEVPDLHYV